MAAVVRQKRNLMEEESFEQAVVLLYPQLYHQAYSLVRDKDASNDLIQDTVLKALRKQHTFQQGTNLKAWLFRIMYHLFVNDYHKQKRGEIRTAHDWMDDKIHSNESNNPDGYRIFEIHAALQKLPENLSTVLLLYADGYKYVEIAEKLAIPEGTVKNRIHVARRRLRSILS